MNLKELEGKYVLIEDNSRFNYNPTLAVITRVTFKKEVKKSWLTGEVISEKDVIEDVFFKAVGENYGGSYTYEGSRYKNWEQMMTRAGILIDQLKLIK